MMLDSRTVTVRRDLQSSLADLEAENEAFREVLGKPLQDGYDVIIIGSGPGGGTLAFALRGQGKSVLLVERGGFLPQEPENWDEEEVLGRQRYCNSEEWIDGTTGRHIQPNMYYYVGGMTKLYSGTLLRLREKDFQEYRHEDGISPAWPVGYDEFEPYYADAERLYLVHGTAGEDPTEPPRSGPFPYPGPPRVPEVQELAERLTGAGLHPFSLPQGLALASGGRCLYCGHCDMQPCRVLAKGDPELCCIRPALHSSSVTLLPNAKAERLLTDPGGGRVTGVEIEHAGERKTIRGNIVVVSCGAVNTPLLLLKSANDRHPNGLANSSGQLGRNYMRHVGTMLLAQVPSRTDLPPDHFWKALGFNDYYLESGDPEWPYPLGTAQLTGSYHDWMHNLLPEDVGGTPEARKALVRQMLPMFLLTEDLPDPDNRVELTSERETKVTYKVNNLQSHNRLIEAAVGTLEGAGYPLVTARSFLKLADGGAYHQCGTARFGDSPSNSVLDRNCRAHDLENLYVLDTCFFPSAPAANPALTVIANTLRVADHIKGIL